MPACGTCWAQRMVASAGLEMDFLSTLSLVLSSDSRDDGDSWCLQLLPSIADKVAISSLPADRTYR